MPLLLSSCSAWAPAALGASPIVLEFAPRFSAALAASLRA
jgi:hypothetical protein